MESTSDVLSAVVLELLKKAGDAGLYKTQIIKLVFFVDLQAALETGQPLTDCEYKTHKYGIVDFAIWDKVKVLSAILPSLLIQKGETSYGKTSHRAILNAEAVSNAAENIVELVEKVWVQYGGLTANELGELTKKLVPMDDEWEIDIRVDVRDIAFERSVEFEEIVRKCRDDFDNFHTGLKPIKDVLVLATDGD